MPNLFNPYVNTGDTPGQSGEIGRRPYPENIFAPGSGPDTAFTISVDMMPGYGWLPPGTIIAKVAEPITGKEFYVPYSKVAPSATDSYDLGKIPLVQDGDSSGDIYVTMLDSYRVSVGEKLRLVDSDTASSDLGAITAIDRTSNAARAKITVTNPGAVTYTVANGACVSPQTKLTSPFTEAVGVLQGGVETGTGTLARGGQGVMVFGNALFEKSLLHNLDATAITSIAGLTINDRYLYLR